MRNITDELSTKGFWIWKRKVPVPQVYIADSISDFVESRANGLSEEIKTTPESTEPDLFEYRGKAIVWFRNQVSFNKQGEGFCLRDGLAECSLMRAERGGLDMRWIDDESFKVPFSYVTHLALSEASVVYVPVPGQVFLRWGRQIEPPTLEHKAMFAMPEVERGYSGAVNIPKGKIPERVRACPYDGVIK